MKDMSSQLDNQRIHILLVPLLTQSHLIPFTDMAKLLAKQGTTVTIAMTPLNSERFNKLFQTSNPNHNQLGINLLSLPFPSQEAGLPQGCESFDSFPSPDLMPLFNKAINLLQNPLENWVGEQITNKPSCIISDFCLPWTEKIALKFNIPRFVFHLNSCFAAVCNYRIATSKVLESIDSDSETFLVPDIPDGIEFTRAQLPLTMRLSPNEKQRARIDEFKASELCSDGILVNSFEELEPKYVEEYRKMKKKKTVWCIGPVNSQLFEGDRERSINELDNCAMKWLDERTKANTVVYACFGSLCHLSTSQLKELAMGLESSNHPFILVVRKGGYYSMRRFDKWLEEENFEERVEGRGLLVRGWAPQAQILNHAAVGGFLTHCGWNSTLEGVAAGRPMITWPMFAEQFHNEKMIVHLLKIGVRVGVEKTVEHEARKDGEGDDDEKGVAGLMGREQIKKAIDDLMSEGDEGEERRRRAREVGEMARRAVRGGSSYLNMSLFLQHISEKLGK